MGHGSIRRHMAWGVEASSRGWREGRVLLDFTIGIDILMNLRTHQRAIAQARAYVHSDYTNRPPIRDVLDTAY